MKAIAFIGAVTMGNGIAYTSRIEVVEIEISFEKQTMEWRVG